MEMDIEDEEESNKNIMKDENKGKEVYKIKFYK